MRLLLTIFAGFFLTLLVLGLATITTVDRTPYQNQAYYLEMDNRLDSLAAHFRSDDQSSVLMAGWASVNITPQRMLSLAGYGARDPKEMLGVHDSSLIRTVVFQNSTSKLAIITADLLIVHPELAQQVWTQLPSGWAKEQIYFCATHTHSGMGAWAPGIVGELFAGQYDPGVVSFIADQMVQSILEAQDQLDTATISFGEIKIEELVKNRLVKERGIVDPWFKTLRIERTNDTRAVMSFYSAHATCLDHENRLLSGDFPTAYNSLLLKQKDIDFSAYAAGAVGSMGPNVQFEDDWYEVNLMAEQLVEQVNLLMMLGAQNATPPTIDAFQLKLPLGDPYFKISEDFAIRSYIFEWAFGTYPHHISVARLGRILMIGLPCDFSGELAVPLYEYARKHGLQLILTSFNGDYTGYVVKDEWYDLPKYEARTMSWYGPQAGSYMTEVIKRIIESLNEN